MSLRTNKLARLFQKEVSMVIAREITNPDIGFVTVTAVQFNRDTSMATVYVSVFGTEKEKAKSIWALNKVKGPIRHALAQRVVLRYMPDLEFREDVQLGQIEKTLELLKKIENSEKKIEE